MEGWTQEKLMRLIYLGVLEALLNTRNNLWWGTKWGDGHLNKCLHKQTYRKPNVASFPRSSALAQWRLPGPLDAILGKKGGYGIWWSGPPDNFSWITENKACCVSYTLFLTCAHSALLSGLSYGRKDKEEDCPLLVLLILLSAHGFAFSPFAIW